MTSLLDARPDLAAQWHPTKNRPLRPADVSSRSPRRVWWKCSVAPDHQWATSIHNRSRFDSGCPFCSGRYASKAHNLAREHPALAAQWHPTKNGELTPRDVPPGSAKRVWWKCPRGVDHEWAQTVARRAQGVGCPFCAGFAVGRDNSLAARRPELAKEWDRDRNGSLRAIDVTSGSSRKVWWRCPQSRTHVYEASIANRAHGRGCPMCAGKKVAPEDRLDVARPDLAKLFHPELNGELSPSDVSVHRTTMVFWRCAKSAAHVWRASPRRLAAPTSAGCPMCARKRATPEQSLAATHPDIAREWHVKKNGALHPTDLLSGSGKRVWWQCSRSKKHAWEAAVSARTGPRRSGCPYCRHLKVDADDSLAATHPEIAAEWHPSRNRPLRPVDVVAGSNRRVWWRCAAARDHEWEAAIPNRALRGDGCPFCRGRRASSTNNLALLEPALAREWHPEKNGTLRPRDVPVGSAVRVWWKCKKGPDHAWEQRVEVRARQGTGCPFCAGHRVSITNSLEALFPEVAEEWHPTKNGELTPAEVLAASHHVASWRCARRHVWTASVRERTLRKRGCPTCAARLIE